MGRSGGLSCGLFFEAVSHSLLSELQDQQSTQGSCSAPTLIDPRSTSIPRVETKGTYLLLLIVLLKGGALY